ncbi:MAG TPA: hypothetical protein VGP72_27530 [Planctomycetota bacterium]|jgi:hypothetical protein
MAMPGTRREAAAPWPNIKKVVDDGATLQIHEGGHHLDIASLYDGEQLICMFRCGHMRFDEIMVRLEELAQRYNETGEATDDVNGS